MKEIEYILFQVESLSSRASSTDKRRNTERRTTLMYSDDTHIFITRVFIYAGVASRVTLLFRVGVTMRKMIPPTSGVILAIVPHNRKSMGVKWRPLNMEWQYRKKRRQRLA